jgi:hypothetical protein
MVSDIPPTVAEAEGTVATFEVWVVRVKVMRSSGNAVVAAGSAGFELGGC